MINKMPKASYPSINKDDIDFFEIPLIPPNKQMEIIKYIESKENKINEEKQNLIELKEKKNETLSNFI
ncbi:hypothetical protein [Gracilibacillus sp. YIM 98692]|uniref:hypothetical protein n=1 Tax=Gracilibacillus sp. YIM 98692 TaxID=2663532 RepID=UPI0013D51F9F|nr:hypothetical protein [Gracilibacillus sp. YIM 98692]